MSANSENQVKNVSSTDVEEHLAALSANANAIAAIASAVQGTLGPKGLNSMLVDRFGDVTITNDGSTILEKIDVNHPAARLLINTARAQAESVGDGTTTATVLAAALVAEGVKHVRRGVPVTRIIEGIEIGIRAALNALQAMSRPVEPGDPLLRRAALVAGREHEDLAELALTAAQRIPQEKLLFDEAFRLASCVIACEGAATEVVEGIVLDRGRMSRQMLTSISPATVLVVDDALECEEMEQEALGTEAGFQRYLQLHGEFTAHLEKLQHLGVNCVVVGRSIGAAAEEYFIEHDILALRRVPARELASVARTTGARPIKRSGLKKSVEELTGYLGRAERVFEDERLGQVRIIGGQGEPAATMVVGATTREVRDERRRIAEDAASAVQAALQGGILPGGGAAEMAASRAVQALRNKARGMSAYGVDCVVEALRRPMAQIIANAGFNPLEKVEHIIALDGENGAMAIDCDTGEPADMYDCGVVDAAPVKVHAVSAAGEIAGAILRINTIIRKKDEKSGSPEIDG